MFQKTQVTVIGAGPAGSECAWQLAKRGIGVKLIDMKPQKMTPAHKSGYFSELVCSNSLRSDELSNAVGLLKAEMRAMDSLFLESADLNRVPAGGALAVDREGFARTITERLSACDNIEIVSEEVSELPEGDDADVMEVIDNDNSESADIIFVSLDIFRYNCDISILCYMIL